ncbi:type II toxin-antitoxin system TacA family antitoxin [Pseudoduganella aquatica]|uniref:type II toxin-antitoxin system TacA family antitoxin n=1 Tax=Pseudoduganella aquatica TaxID=2660641 RepID=UPI001E5608BD|nr:DUF1778 domain-containing protein [Pseudoduganella aquatica]
MNAPLERERITARVSSTVAETLSEAADLTGTTLNNFVIQAALKEAQRVIDREKTISISKDDAAMLLSLLDSPPAPNEALKRAFDRFIKVKYGTDGTGTGKTA